MAQLEVRDMHPAFGVEIVGLEPDAELDEGTRRFLRDLFDDRALLLFRDVDVDLAFQTSLSRILIGEEPPSEDEATSAALRDPYYVSNKERGGGAPFGRLLFHTDGMWRDDAFQLLSLYAVNVEPPVEPTIFASTTRAWDTLPDDLRARVEHLHAEHGHDATYPDRGDGDVLVATFERPESTITPVGHRHPRTGRTMLYVSQMMTQRIVELSPQESEELLKALFAHLYDPANLFQHEWRNGDLVLWDNLALQHARPNLLAEGPIRTLRKVFAPPPAIGEHTKPRHRTRGQEDSPARQ